MEATWVRRRNVKAGRLADHPLIAGCSRAETARIARVCEEVEVAAGETLARQGWMGNWLFLIQSGVAEVARDGRKVGLMWPGEHFGELELLGGDVNAATVTARTSMTLFVVHRPYFPALVEDVPSLRRALWTSLQARLGPSAEDTVSPMPVRAGGLPSASVVPKTVGPEDLERTARKILRRWEEDKAKRRKRTVRRLRRFAIAVVIAGLCAIPAARIHPPLVVMAPGDAIDLSRDIAIEGTDASGQRSRYLVTPVRFDRPSLLGVARDAFRSDREVLPQGRVFPPGDSASAVRRAREVYRRSRLVAAAAAARAAGIDVALAGTGVRVRSIVPGITAGVLRARDVIVAIDSHPVRLASEVLASIRTASADSLLRFTVERDGGRIDLDIPASAAVLGAAGDWFGVELETRDPSFRLPFEIEFRERDVTGASSGLAYALAIYDMLTPGDLAHGAAVAATGTLDAEGEIGSVGGLGEKAEAARAAGARLMLVPLVQSDEAEGHSVLVVGVRNLADAIAALRAQD